MLKLGHRVYDDDLPLVMAIVNRTPDSFYDRGATYAADAAFERIGQVVAEGVDVVDIGGVKAGYGEEVSAAEEYDAALVCTHTGGLRPRTDPHRQEYADVMGEVVSAVTAYAARAVAAGVAPSSVVIDPAHDFAKNTFHSLEVTRRLGEMIGLGYPVLVSVSNKDFVGETLGRPVEERLPGTLAATAVCALAGARIYRAHQVRETRDVVDMVWSIAGRRPPYRALRGLS